MSLNVWQQVSTIKLKELYLLVYLISCPCCKLQYVGSVLTFEERFLIDKSDIGTSKKRCGAAKHFLECSTKSCFIYFNESHLKMMKNAFYLI